MEISSSEVTPIQQPSKRKSCCSVFISSEDITSAPVSSEVDERQSIGRPASPLLMQEREASAMPARIYHFTRESSMSRSSHIPSTRKPIPTHSHKRKSSRDRRSVQEKHLTSEIVRSEQQEVRDFQKFRAEAVQGEHEACSRLTEAEVHTGRLLEEQSNQVLSLGHSSRSERAGDAIRELERHIMFIVWKTTTEIKNMKLKTSLAPCITTKP